MFFFAEKFQTLSLIKKETIANNIKRGDKHDKKEISTTQKNTQGHGFRQ